MTYDTMNRARAVIVHGSRLLVSRPNARNRLFGSDMLFLPGGHIRRGETARAAVIRELNEELGAGWDGVETTLLGVGDIHWRDAAGGLHDEINFIFFVALPQAADPCRLRSSVDYIDYIWADMDSVEKRLYPRSIALSLRGWLEAAEDMEKRFAEEKDEGGM